MATLIDSMLFKSFQNADPRAMAFVKSLSDDNMVDFFKRYNKWISETMMNTNSFSSMDDSDTTACTDDKQVIEELRLMDDIESTPSKSSENKYSTPLVVKFTESGIPKGMVVESVSYKGKIHNYTGCFVTQFFLETLSFIHSINKTLIPSEIKRGNVKFSKERITEWYYDIPNTSYKYDMSGKYSMYTASKRLVTYIAKAGIDFDELKFVVVPK